MFPEDESQLLAPHFSLVARWSARVREFVHEWEERLSQADPAHPFEFWVEAACSAIGGVEQGCHQAQDVLADIYHVSGQLLTVGDSLVVEPLEMKVDQRLFTRRLVGGLPHIEVVYYLGVEKYRYAEPSGPANAAQASI